MILRGILYVEEDYREGCHCIQPLLFDFRKLGFNVVVENAITWSK